MMTPMAVSLIATMASSLINVMPGKGVKRAGRGQVFVIFPLLAMSLIMKVVGKGVTRADKGYNNLDYMDNFFCYLHPLSNTDITEYFNYKPTFNGAFSRDNLPRIKDERLS